MHFWLVTILNLCILIPAVLGCIRYSKINRVYYPVVYCIWIGAIIEVISHLFILSGYSNAVVSNIYVLVESILLSWQFKNWGIFDKRKYLFTWLIPLFLATWCLENFVFSKIIYFSSYFRIVYSFIIVIMSIIIINRLIVTERKSLLKNSTFLICIAFVFYYTLKVIVEAFWLYGLNDNQFSTNLYDIAIFTNFFANLIYSVAILWMPNKQRFTLPSS